MIRIGEFSRYFGVPASTVRYYIKFGLLLPEVRNKQNLFGEDCIRDMKHIIEWKSMHFSLDMILELITIERKSRLSFDMDTERLVEIYLEHEKLLQRQQQTVDVEFIQLKELLSEVETGILP